MNEWPPSPMVSILAPLHMASISNGFQFGTLAHGLHPQWFPFWHPYTWPPSPMVSILAPLHMASIPNGFHSGTLTHGLHLQWFPLWHPYTWSPSPIFPTLAPQYLPWYFQHSAHKGTYALYLAVNIPALCSISSGFFPGSLTPAGGDEVKINL